MSPKRAWTIAGLMAIVALSYIGAPYPEYFPLQHLLTVVSVGLYIYLSRRYPISTASFVCLCGFLLVHTIGARYIYSNVPYDHWAKVILGKSLSELFGWTRNHYDRFVHFAYGVLFFIPAREVFIRYLSIPKKKSDYFALEFVMASSMLYEVIEWVLTVFVAPDVADAYNGQQGDMWDSQKDMVFAVAGALLVLIILRLPFVRKNREIRASQAKQL